MYLLLNGFNLHSSTYIYLLKGTYLNNLINTLFKIWQLYVLGVYFNLYFIISVKYVVGC